MHFCVINEAPELEIGLTDVWRKLYPNEQDYTDYSTAHNKYSRLDYFSIFKTDLEKVSDYAIITIKWNFEIEKKPMLWRLMTIKNKIWRAIKHVEINDNGEASPAMVWEGAKAVIQGELIMLASHKTKGKRKKGITTLPR